MSAIELRSKRSSEGYAVQDETFRIINDLIQPSSATSVQNAAEQIDQLLPMKRTKKDGEELESAESFMWEMWVCQSPFFRSLSWGFLHQLITLLNPTK